jgi:hypothetical protein
MNIKTKGYWLRVLLAAICVFSSCTKNDDANDENTVSNNYIVVQSSVLMSGNSRSQKVDLEANCQWKVTYDKGSWTDLVVTPTEGTGSTTIIIESSVNNTEDDRYVDLKFSTIDGDLPRVCKVTQSAGDFQAELSLAPDADGNKIEKIDVEYDSIARDVSIICNTSWLVEKADVNWCSVINGEGVNNGKFSLIIFDNPSVEERTTSVRVVTQNRSGKQIPLIIPVNQKGAPKPTASVKASLAEDGVTITINGTAYSNSKYDLTEYGYEIVSEHDSIHKTISSVGSVREKSFTVTVKEEDGYVYKIRTFATTQVCTEYSDPFELPLPGNTPENGDNTSPPLSRKQ